MDMNKALVLQTVLNDNSLDGIIVMKPQNMRYLSGFTGSAGLILCTANKYFLITDSRYVEQATQQAAGFTIIRQSTQLLSDLQELIQKLGVVRVGFDSDYATYSWYEKASEFLTTIELVSISDLNKIRQIKTHEEIALIRQAVVIADQAFSHILTLIKPGLSEIDIACELEYQMRKLGAEGPAFTTIVASGIRSSLPHGIATEKKIEIGDIITMDFGAIYKGYHSDITRSVVLGKSSPKQQEVYKVVYNAQLAAVQKLSAGQTNRKIDFVARQIIADAGYGNFFGHGLGHGVGLEIHEEPRLSPQADEIELSAGMVVTVEPGIYLPGWGGIRIEDTIVVDVGTCQVLTASDKQLIEILA